jgi:hypothetical protein
MDPLFRTDAVATGEPTCHPLGIRMPLTEAAMRYSRNLPVVAADAGLAIFAFAANQTVTGQVTFAHLVGDLARAQAQELAATGARTMPDGALRAAVMTMADAQTQFADQVIDAGNRWGRSFAHMVFAFPISRPAE